VTAAGRVYHLARADFLERTRRYGFLIVMGLTVYAGYMMVPPVEAPYNAFAIGGHRAYYSSAWVGTIFGAVCASLLTLVGFFLIRNSVGRDRVTRVGRIIAGTPTTRVSYVLGKWLSNLAVLTAILAVLTLIAPLMQLVRAEDRHLDPVALVTALWMIGLPPLALVAALAVLFETTPVLRGALGSVVFVGLWVAVLIFSIGGAFTSRTPMPPLFDLAGVSPSMGSLYAAAQGAGLAVDSGATDLFEPTRGHEVRRFVWTGVRWSAGAVAMRFAWLGIALALAATAALPFDRFDTSRARARPRRTSRPRRARGGRRVRPREETTAVAIGVADSSSVAARARLTPLATRRTGHRLFLLVWSELRTMVRGRAWWWYGAGLALVVTLLAAPARYAIGLVTPGLWLLPIAVWSAMGNREVQAGTTPIVYSTPHPLRRQLTATWLAGVLVGLAVAGVTSVRPLIGGDLGHVAGLAAGAVFVPSLALALGTWTGSNRAFEIVYTILWYLGVFGRMAPFDFLGASRHSVEAGVPLWYLALAIPLLGVAVAGRRRQLLHST
jgi:predicted secreted protein